MSDSILRAKILVPVPLPPALENLATLNRILLSETLHSELSKLSVEAKFNHVKEFIVKNAQGQLIFDIAKISNEDNLLCCCRRFEMHVYDINEVLVMTIDKKYFFCDNIKIYSPPGTLVGSVEECLRFRPLFSIKDSIGIIKLYIVGRCCASTNCGRNNFDITDIFGRKLGKIEKIFTSCNEETIYSSGNIRMCFPSHLHLRLKAILLGACMFISERYFSNRM